MSKNNIKISSVFCPTFYPAKDSTRNFVEEAGMAWEPNSALARQRRNEDRSCLKEGSRLPPRRKNQGKKRQPALTFDRERGNDRELRSPPTIVVLSQVIIRAKTL